MAKFKDIFKQLEPQLGAYAALLPNMILDHRAFTLAKKELNNDVTPETVLSAFNQCMLNSTITISRYEHYLVGDNQIQFDVSLNSALIDNFIGLFFEDVSTYELEELKWELTKEFIVLIAAYLINAKIDELLQTNIDTLALCFLYRATLPTPECHHLLPPEMAALNKGISIFDFYLKNSIYPGDHFYNSQFVKEVTAPFSLGYRLETKRSKKGTEKSTKTTKELLKNRIPVLFTAIRSAQNIRGYGSNTYFCSFRLNEFRHYFAAYKTPAQFNPSFIPTMIKYVNKIDPTLSIQEVFDPCAGWGDRAAGTILSGANYTGIDPSAHSKQCHESIGKFFLTDEFFQIAVNLKAERVAQNIQNRRINFIEGKMQDFLNDSQRIPPAQLAITCPPYSHGQEKYQNLEDIPVNEFVNRFLSPLISCMNAHLVAGGFAVVVVGQDMYGSVHDILQTMNARNEIDFKGDGAYRPHQIKEESQIEPFFIWRRPTDARLFSSPKLDYLHLTESEQPIKNMPRNKKRRAQNQNVDNASNHTDAVASTQEALTPTTTNNKKRSFTPGLFSFSPEIKANGEEESLLQISSALIETVAAHHAAEMDAYLDDPLGNTAFHQTEFLPPHLALLMAKPQ